MLMSLSMSAATFLYLAAGVAICMAADFLTLRTESAPHLSTDEQGRSVSRYPSDMSRSYISSIWNTADGVGYRSKYQLSSLKTPSFWHKFPHKQQVEPVTEAPATQAPTQEPDNEMPTPMATEAPAPAPAPTPTSPSTSRPTRKPTKRPLPPHRPPPPVYTVRPPVVRPLKPIKPLKELLLFGSPTQANILHRAPAAVSKPKGKGFLSLFEVIKFENTKCMVKVDELRSMEGICYHDFECRTHGGIATERCAEGVGVCCIFVNGCGDTTSQSVVYFESPNYPSAVREMMICVLLINLRKHVQQLRLDFNMFELNRPTNGDCVDDQFIVSGQNLNFVVPVLCGINTGQHVYVHVDQSLERKVYLSFLSKVPTGGRAFNIKVTQLEENLAPKGCLQFHTEPEGVVKSFNYDVEGTYAGPEGATYLNNLNYAICLERGKNACSVSYSVELLDSNQLDFQIVNKDENENDLVPDGQAGAGIFNCPDDFIAVNQVRLCGERFNDGASSDDFNAHALVRDLAGGPIILPVRSDEEYVGHGFRLAYRQEMCL